MNELNKPIMDQPERGGLKRKRINRKILRFLNQEGIENSEAIRDRIMVMVDSHVRTMTNKIIFGKD